MGPVEFPKVSIVCVTYLESSKPYLDACLTSITNLDYDHSKIDLTLVSSGEYSPKYDGLHHHHSETRLHFPEAVNLGVSLTDPDSKYLFIINDDVILTKNSLKNLVSCTGNHQVIAGPISNCDNGLLYNLVVAFPKDGKHYALGKRFYRYDELKDVLPNLMDAESHYFHGFFKVSALYFYAVLIPRSVWDKLGPLDPKFKTGQDDIDYSLRASKANIQTVVSLSSLVWHFGGVTADQVIDKQTRIDNINYFNEKWTDNKIGTIE